MVDASSLPGEIRNVIYALVYQEGLVQVRRAPDRAAVRWRLRPTSSQLFDQKLVSDLDDVRRDVSQSGTGEGDDDDSEDIVIEESVNGPAHTKSLLQVCRMVRFEATPFMYGAASSRRELVFANEQDFQLYIASLDIAARSCVRNVVIWVQRPLSWRNYRFTLPVINKGRLLLSNLQNLRLNVRVSCHFSSENLAGCFDNHIPDWTKTSQLTVTIETHECISCSQIRSCASTSEHQWWDWVYAPSSSEASIFRGKGSVRRLERTPREYLHDYLPKYRAERDRRKRRELLLQAKTAFYNSLPRGQPRCLVCQAQLMFSTIPEYCSHSCEWCDLAYFCSDSCRWKSHHAQVCLDLFQDCHKTLPLLVAAIDMFDGDEGLELAAHGSSQAMDESHHDKHGRGLGTELTFRQKDLGSQEAEETWHDAQESLCETGLAPVKSYNETGGTEHHPQTSKSVSTSTQTHNDYLTTAEASKFQRPAKDPNTSLLRYLWSLLAVCEPRGCPTHTQTHTEGDS